MTHFSLEHFCEPLMEDPSYFSKKMFGGLAVYYNDLMIFVLMESPGDREYRNQKFDFDIWNGVMVCTSREHHESLVGAFANLISHPVLGKWLYTPMADAGFESTFEGLVHLAELKDPRVGIVPGQKRAKKASTRKAPTKKAAIRKKQTGLKNSAVKKKRGKSKASS